MAAHERQQQRPARPKDKVRVADHRRRQLRQLAAPGRRVLQGRRPGRQFVPGPHARRPRRLPRPRHRVHRRVRRRRRARSARTSPTRSGRTRTTRSSSPTSRRPGIKVSRGMTHDGHRQVPLRGRREGARRDRRRRRHPQGDGTDVVVNYLPVGSEEATKWYAEQILDAGCAMVNCMPVFIAREALLAAPLRAGRRADHRRRHQVAGRRDDHAPRAHDASSASAASTSTRRCS